MHAEGQSRAGVAAAFFDLDGTLITANSASLWMRAERRAGRLGWRQLVEGALYLALYRVHSLDMPRLMRKALETIRGRSEGEIEQRIREWFRADVLPLVAPGARPAVERHRARGDLLVLVTSASVYEAALVAREFGLDAFLATGYEVVDGRFTGDVRLPLCYGEGKVVLVEVLADERGIDLGRSWFYTDSFTDEPLLRRVGHPRVVNPDPRLRRLARREGWPVEDWSRP
jgi:HAD superfamily hydrolase (TIGR01490 family)